ncbi:HIT family protein [Stygiolobus caldivivus]|uniref:Hydrolase n=1 Tax=Stygiolobus caldivivus TaxID=2824673 RepID=A0A8D5ZJF7_9CREN|nr:HIT domain-containing protein [Stygiolobus caldivivus]BCU70561.1 hydrolase [Stygiolobus caldivivus]
MDVLWAPWRSKYILEASKKKDDTCIFCEFPKSNNDKGHLIVFRAKYNFVILNAYPYNPGHIMVVPYRHVSSLELLSEEESSEMFFIIKRSLKVLRKVYSPDGFNIGANIGRVAGAGIDQHVHVHIVPRWNGDANFMPVIGNIKVLPELLEDTYNKLYVEFNSKDEAFDL